MPALLLTTIPSGAPPGHDQGGDDVHAGSLLTWLLGASIVVAAVFALAEINSQRTVNIAAVIAGSTVTISLVPWLWVTWMERRTRWVHIFRLMPIAIGVIAAAQLAATVIDLDTTDDALAPSWVDLLRVIGVSIAVFAVVRESVPSRRSRRRSYYRALRAPVAATLAVTLSVLIAVPVVSARTLSGSAGSWLLCAGLIAGPTFIAMTHLLRISAAKSDDILPHQVLAVGWVAVAVGFTGVAVDRLLGSQIATPRTNWSFLPALAFLTAAAIDVLERRFERELPASNERTLAPSKTWLRILAPLLIAAIATTFAAVQLVRSRELGSVFVAAVALSIALAILLQQTVAHVRLARAASRFEQTRVELAMQATVDPVTGLPNRRALDARLSEEVERAIRYKQPLSLCFVDVDHFKDVNDVYGHATGDYVLREVATMLRRTARGIDFVGRYGGEEFVMLLPGTWSVDAITLGDRVRRAVSHHAFNTNGTQPIRLTISVGIAGLPEHAQTGESLRDCADTAVYHAKRAGRNQVTLFDPAA